MQKGIETRYIIHEILKILKNRPIGLDKIFAEKVERKNFSISDRNMIKNVVLNTMRYHLFVEQILKQFAKNIDKSSNSYFLLLSAITQLLVLKFKDFAVINSTVELAKDKRIKAPKNFINAILRNINRNKKQFIELSYNFSQLPNWFKKRVISWNKKQKNDFIKTICKEPSLHLVFKNKKDLEQFADKNIQTSNYSVAIKNSMPIRDISGFKEGLWWVQDFSAMMPLYLNNNLNNKVTADLCAAPGGKSFQLISYGAKVNAFEKDRVKAERMKENLKRLKLNCSLEVKDVLEINDKQKYDLIILDAPCSAIGTIRRHPEILFRKKSPDFKKTTSIQARLLEKAKTILKKNGILIYIVCSFFPEEGNMQISKFLNNNKDFKLLKFSSTKTKIEKLLIDKKGFYFVLPSQLYNNVFVDGFFAAKLKKND